MDLTEAQRALGKFKLDARHLEFDRVEPGQFSSRFVQKVIGQHQFDGQGDTFGVTVNNSILFFKTKGEWELLATWNCSDALKMVHF